MGVDTRRPMLPAPTESIVDTITRASATGTDMATDVSQRTDRSSYSVPEDGTPVTIPMRRKHRDREDSTKLSRSSHHSQTSLLIEYFEGGKSPGGVSSRPSVRVRVTPSVARKLRDKNDQIQITESGGSRIPFYTRRIALSSPSRRKQLPEAGGDDQSIASSNSAADEGPESSPRRPPLEIEFVHRDQASELSNMSREAGGVYPATSDISTMPPDSMLDTPSELPRRKRSQSLERSEDPQFKDLLKTPTRQRSRSLSHERIAHRVAEKLAVSSREPAEGMQSRYETSRERSKGFANVSSRTSRRHTQNYKDEERLSPESSLLSVSAVSSQHRSDQYSIRSAASKSSINNPRLLETVEDAIRRLILPELKELKKDQKGVSNKSKLQRDSNTPFSSTRSISRDETGGRLSKHVSAPDVMESKDIFNKETKADGTFAFEEHQSTKRDRKSSRGDSSPSEKPYNVRGKRPELNDQDKLRRQKSKGLRDAEAAGIVGTALTAAALRHHDSRTSLDSKGSGRRRRRKSDRRRSGGSGSINETELVFEKHNVAPMPLSSAIDSDITRDSILSQQSTEMDTPTRASKEPNIVGSSPLEIAASGSRTPARPPLDSPCESESRLHNSSSRDLDAYGSSEGHFDRGSRSSMDDAAAELAAGAIAAAAAANLLDSRLEHNAEGAYNEVGKHRALSPIQSVASDQTETNFEQDIALNMHEDAERDTNRKKNLSIDSLSSAPSTNLARSTRLEAVSPESRSGALKQHEEAGPELGYEDLPRDWRQDNEVDEARIAFEHSGRGKEARRMSDFKDDSELDYIEKINQGQRVADVGVANPEFVYPVAVESAVASLLEPSVLDSKSEQSSSLSQVERGERLNEGGYDLKKDNVSRNLQASRRGSPLKQHLDADRPDAASFPARMGVTSPPQSVAQSIEEQQEAKNLIADDFRGVESPSDEANHDLDSESEINTNPSIIQGPIGGVSHKDEDHWPYNNSPSKSDHKGFDEAMAAAAGVSLHGQDHYQPVGEDEFASHGLMGQRGDTYMNGQIYATPPGAKALDEGYVSGANPRSPSVDSPKLGGRGLGAIDDTAAMGLFDIPTGVEDPFGPSHQKYLSGYSHGISSPLYDSATGGGIDRIQSKDIIALMEHLTVRDAQRNARDTEILVTLVRSAAEMRNSFEEMKKFIAHQDEILIDAGEKQHERTQRALGGPRPQPLSASKSSRQLSTDDGEDLRAKRRNMFRRALKGLSMKSSNDLTKIEEMLEHLLEEVEALRAAQQCTNNGMSASVDPEGYEPEGRAGTASTLNQSGHLSSSSRAVYDARGNGQRKDGEGRISTVHEADEDPDLQREVLSPHLPLSEEAPMQRHERAGSVPLDTPTRVPVSTGALSNESTPKTAEKARKHKSSSSSFFPKISRWSKTTASSVGDNIRNSFQPGRKDRPFSYASQSGSDLGGELYKTAGYYDSQGYDRFRSSYTLDEQQQQENRPPSPLVPSQVSETPKYRAHRGSLDLQHPQPRQGPNGRYHSQLESQAQNFCPVSPNSERWLSSSSLPHGNPGQNRHSGASRLSPISDTGHSEATTLNGPPRPPKIKDDGPLVPGRPPKVKEEGSQGGYAERFLSRSAAVRRSPRHTPPEPPTRKPTGPRPLTTSTQNGSGNLTRNRYRGNPDHINDSYDY